MTPTRCALSLPLLLSLIALAPGALAASAPQKGYELSGTPRPEFLLEELRGLVGRKFWIRKPESGQIPKTLFCDSKGAPAVADNATACPSEKYGVAAAEQFTIEELIVGKPNPASSWFRIKFASGKTVWLATTDFQQNRYTESRLPTAPHDIEFIIANSGWIFDDYPPRILDQRRAQYEQARSDPQRDQERLERERVTRLKLLYIGMTTQQVLNSTWGPPNFVTNTVQDWRRLEQWDYGGGTVLYFENDRLLRIQVGRR